MTQHDDRRRSGLSRFVRVEEPARRRAGADQREQVAGDELSADRSAGESPPAYFGLRDPGDVGGGGTGGPPRSSAERRAPSAGAPTLPGAARRGSMGETP